MTLEFLRRLSIDQPPAVSRKHDFSDTQLSILNKRIMQYVSEVELEKAKTCHVEQNFEDTASHMQEADNNVRNVEVRATTCQFRIPKLSFARI